MNEKTAEINVSTNMINNARMVYPKAYVFGFTIRYEKKKGLDTSIRGGFPAWAVGFQFKKAYRKKNDVYWFRFNNDKLHNQHNLMHKAALTTRKVPMIYYALPAYEDLDSFRLVSPNFLSRTFFIDIQETPMILDRAEHKFEVNIVNRTYTIHSKKILGKGEVITWDELFRKIKEKEIGMQFEKFVSLIESTNTKFHGNVKSYSDIELYDDVEIKLGQKTSKASTQLSALIL